ncbi:S-layer homology domain-containing protein [Paenibacillus sp. YYML68]|uniref:S-layer homology domain-containing protein n=1 Tax=Paenibacillus sp. YYML68 TaxID=2909250 RepID=UPI0024922ADF|nr:S-layer homology domain-containing protein [Paenibacillus sp. YYML68]
MKNKVIASTVAASLALGSFAGLPLSTNGLLEKLGVSTAHAESSATVDSVAVRLQQYQAFLWEEERVQSIRDARAELKNVTDVELVRPLTEKIKGSKVSATSSARILKLFARLGLFFNTNSASAYEYLNDAEVRETLEALAKNADTSLSDPELTVQDAVDFAMKVQDEVLDELKSQSLLELASLANDKVKIKAFIKEAIADVLADDNAFSNVLKHQNTEDPINADDVAQVIVNLIDAVDPEREAVENIALSVLRYEANTSIKHGDSGKEEYSLSFNVLGIEVPAALMKWEFVPSSTTDKTITVDGTKDSKVTVKLSSVGEVSGTINGYIKLAAGMPLNDVLLVKKDSVSLKKEEEQTPPDGNPGNGNPDDGTTGSNTTPPPAEPIEELDKELDKVGQELATLPLSEQLAKLDGLVKQAAAALDKVATVDLKDKVTVTGDKAEVKVDAAALTGNMKKVAEEAKKVNDKLKELGAPIVKPELKLALGEVKAKEVKIPLPKDLFAGAADNGVELVRVEFNDVSIGMDPSEFGADTTVDVQTLDKNVVPEQKRSSLVSTLLDFTFTVGGQVKSTFETPIDLRLNIPTHPEPDYLSIFKVEVDNRLTNYGGKFSNGSVGSRLYTFSAYTVMENKVSFDDTSSVNAWAGRQIQSAAAKGIVEGRADKQFVPNDSVTRAEFAKMIVNAYGLNTPNAKETFDDVEATDWFAPYVAAAVKHGLVNGRSEGKFEPNGKITRAEMATIAARALSAVNGWPAVKDVDASLKKFTDNSSIDSTLKAGVALSTAHGIVIGEENEKFNPNGDSTRAQAAVVIYRLLNK